MRSSLYRKNAFVVIIPVVCNKIQSCTQQVDFNGRSLGLGDVCTSDYETVSECFPPEVSVWQQIFFGIVLQSGNRVPGVAA